MDAANIVKIFNDFELDMNLSQAWSLADRIINEFQPEISSSYAKGYNSGVLEGREQAKNEGYVLDKPELVKLRGMEDCMVEVITKEAAAIIDKFGKDYKIKCIKVLRDKFPFLSLREAKDYINIRFEQIEREEAERAAYSSYDSYDYSYNPVCDSDCPVCNR